MPDIRQFVVQRHEAASSVHWDLMIEHGEVLATWHVPVPPEQVGPDPVPAERIFDHPNRFLDYEGPLRRHPGSVRIHDRGRCEVSRWSDDAILVIMEGHKLAGLLRLDRPEAGQWQLTRPESGPQTPGVGAPD